MTSNISVKISVEEGRELVAADYGLSGSKSDPYVIVKAGATEIGRTQVKSETLAPVWNVTFDHNIPVATMCNSWLEFEVFDKDTLSADDELGAVRLQNSLLADKLLEQNDSTKGSVVLYDGWLKLSRPHHVTGELKIKVVVDMATVTDADRTLLSEEPLTTMKLGVALRCPEQIKLRIHDVVFSGVRGSLILGQFHIIFAAYDLDKDSTFSLPIGSIGGFKDSESWKGGMKVHRLSMTSRDYTVYNFDVTTKTEVQHAIHYLAAEIKWASEENTFAFRFAKAQGRAGWEFRFDMREEMLKRQRVVELGPWRETKVNAQYGLSPTYPEILYVPMKASDELVRKAAACRSKKRMVVLTWIHPETRTPLLRSSQPLTGMVGSTPDDDELLSMVRSTAAQALTKMQRSARGLRRPSVQPKRLQIVDCRPHLNATGNALKGKGFENVDSRTAVLCFAGIGNIHVMRDALKLTRKSQAADPITASGDAGGCVGHIKSVLDGAITVVKSLTRGQPTLVHCSDGWDRTSQLSSLPQLMLDPFYRTRKGFATLVEKDWLSFGHMFEERTQLPFSKKGCLDTHETSPVFLQFLECVFNLLLQFPREFEINEAFLREVASEGAMGARLYGNFLYDTEQKRRGLEERTLSLWDVLLTGEAFANPLYSTRHSDGDQHYAEPLLPLTHLGMLRLWPALSFNHIQFSTPRWNSSTCRAEYDRINGLESLVRELWAKLKERDDAIAIAASGGDGGAARILELSEELSVCTAELRERRAKAISRSASTRSARAMTLGYNDTGDVLIDTRTSSMWINLKTLGKLRPGDKINSSGDFLEIDHPGRSLFSGLARTFRGDSRSHAIGRVKTLFSETCSCYDGLEGTTREELKVTCKAALAGVKCLAETTYKEDAKTANILLSAVMALESIFDDESEKI